jgi:flagellar biosynthesis/type III secretory pathway chaperone
VSDTGEQLSSALAGQLTLGVALLEQLQELLAQETTILASGNHEPLSGLAEDKQRLVVRLIDLSKALVDLLSRAGYSPDGEGLAQYIQALPDSDALAGLYATAMQALRTCAVYNQANGSLLERRRSAVDRALHILFDHPDGGRRYYASGRLEGLTPNRLIGAA